MGKPTPERSKVVIKNLPPLLPEKDFLAAIEAVCKGHYHSMRYVPGRQRYSLLTMTLDWYSVHGCLTSVQKCINQSRA